jgi:Tol biopolymer transport system component
VRTILVLVAATLAAAAAGAADAAPPQTPCASKAATDTDPQVSPDGRFLVFRRRPLPCSRREAVWLSDLDGHGLRRLVGPTEMLRRVSWRSDGVVSATVGTETRLVSPRGKILQRLSLLNPFWSPDGSRALYVDPPSRQLRLWPGDKVVGGARSSLTAPSWSPAGDRFAYARQDAPRDPFILVVARPDGTDATSPFAAPSIDAPVWSPDGISLAFAATSVLDAPSTDLYVSRADSTDDLGDLTPWTFRVGGYAWSPDGRWIAFSAFGKGSTFELYVIHPEGTGLRRVATHVLLQDEPAWRRDSAVLLYAGATRRCSRIGIFAVRTSGRGVRRLTNRCR